MPSLQYGRAAKGRMLDCIIQGITKNAKGLLESLAVFVF